MKQARQFIGIRKISVAVGLGAALALPPGVALSQMSVAVPVLWPLTTTAQGQSGPTEAFIQRTGTVMLDVERFRPAAEGRSAQSVVSRSLALQFFPDRQFAASVESETRPQPQVLALSARLVGHDLATVSITVTADSYLMSVQDMDHATLYRVVGNSNTGVGQVTEIDLRKLPPMFDGAPVVVSED